MRMKFLATLALLAGPAGVRCARGAAVMRETTVQPRPFTKNPR